MQDFYRTSVQEGKFISWLTVSNTFLGFFFLVYKLWSLYEKLLLYQKNERTNTNSHPHRAYDENKLEKGYKRLKKNTQLVEQVHSKACLYCTWNHLKQTKSCQVINI